MEILGVRGEEGLRSNDPLMRSKLFLLLLAAGLFVVLASLGLSCASRRAPALGVSAGRLLPCPDSPNCVCSQDDPASPSWIEPLELRGDAGDELERLAKLLEATPRASIVERGEGYLRAEFTTALLRFVDDVEFLVEAPAGVIHVRSASRVGHSDLGANRKRIEELRARWLAERR